MQYRREEMPVEGPAFPRGIAQHRPLRRWSGRCARCESFSWRDRSSRAIAVRARNGRAGSRVRRGRGVVTRGAAVVLGVEARGVADFVAVAVDAGAEPPPERSDMNSCEVKI